MCVFASFLKTLFFLCEDVGLGGSADIKMGITFASHSVGKVQEYINKCTILQYEVFTTKTLGVQNVSTLSCGSSSRILHQYLFKM
jgi:hypothetical protein